MWRRRPCALGAAVRGAVTIGVAATYGQTRFRAAAEPSLAILAAVGVLTLFPRLARAWRESGEESAPA
jgi:hypothetical protein